MPSAHTTGRQSITGGTAPNGARRMSHTAAFLVGYDISYAGAAVGTVAANPATGAALRAAQTGHAVLQVVQRVIACRLLDDAGLPVDEGHSSAIALIPRFGSAANPNIHLHCLVQHGFAAVARTARQP